MPTGCRRLDRTAGVAQDAHHRDVGTVDGQLVEAEFRPAKWARLTGDQAIVIEGKLATGLSDSPVPVVLAADGEVICV